MIRFYFLMSLMLLVCLPAHALRPGLMITQYPRTQWTTSSSLPADSITALAQTNDGYIWFGSSAGLCRFNGKQTIVFNVGATPALKTNSITSLLKAKNGTLWIGTEGGGLLSYDQSGFKAFSIDDGLSDNTILALAQDGSDNLWILTSIDVNVFNGKTFTIAPVQHPTTIFADRDAVLIGSETGFTMIRNGKTIQYPGPRVTAIYRGTKGKIWIGAPAGLYELQDNKMVSKLDCEEVRSILEDRDGNVWIGTMRGLRLLHKTSPLHPYIHNAVVALFEDREGSIWAATSGEGLQALFSSAFSMISANEGLPTSRSWCVLLDHASNLWIGTDDGVSRWSDQQISNFHLSSSAKTLAEDASGSIWAGTSAGVFHLEQNSFVMKFSGIHPTSMIAQKNGDLWIGSNDGLRMISQGKITQVSSEEITTLYMDRSNQLWAGTKTGLKLWRNENLENTPINDEVSAIATDQQGNLWAGSLSRLYNIRNKKINSDSLGGFGTEPLPTGLVQDRNGNLWIATTQGIFRGSMIRGHLGLTPLPAGGGLQSSEASGGQPSIFLSPDGARLWIATVNGVAEIDPERLLKKKTPPPVMIESVEHNRVPAENFRKENLSFPPDTSRIEFHYAALSYLPGVKFRYVLQGYDQFWTDAGAQTRAVYTNFPPGKYRFKLLAGREDSWNIAGDSVSFEIEAGMPHLSQPSILYLVFTLILGFVAGWFARRLILKRNV